MKLPIMAATAGLVFSMAATPVLADKLDDIIASGVLRCAVTLDFPPMGSRDDNN
jgi:hydroxyproline transporter system substrate-binding protein